MTNRSRFTCLSGAADEAASPTMQPGETVLYAPSGTFFHAGVGGDLGLTLPTIAGVRIADPADLADHCRVRGDTTVEHHFRFHRGGSLKVVSDLQGAVMELHGEGLMLFADANGVVVRAYQPARAQ